jgi:ribonuclease PH
MTRKPAPIRAHEARDPSAPVFARRDGRAPADLRMMRIRRQVLPNAEGSAFITLGSTRVLCTASIDNRAPGWLRGTGRGWVTAEYGMLPRATNERTSRTSQTGGRAQEIQRLIGRSLRAITDLTMFGERTIILDCDVIEADGGTRTAAINGAMVALHDAFVTMSNRNELKGPPLKDSVAAVSVGIVKGVPCLDLDYSEDSTAAVDMNVVMTGAGSFVELQGTGETGTFDHRELKELLRLARRGVRRITARHRRLMGDSGLLPEIVRAG